MVTTTAPSPARWTVAAPLLAAASFGVLAGLAPLPLVLALGGLAVVAAVLLKLEWLALTLVAASLFEDYATRAGPGVVKGLAVLLVLAWIVRRCRGRLHVGPRSPVLVAATAFVAVLLLATAVHNNGAAGLAVVLRYAGFLGVLFVLADAMRGGLRPERVAQVYVVASVVPAACGLLTFAVGADRRVGGPIGDPNDFAFFLLPLSPSASRSVVRRGTAGRGTSPPSWCWWPSSARSRVERSSAWPRWRCSRWLPAWSGSGGPLPSRQWWRWRRAWSPWSSPPWSR